MFKICSLLGNIEKSPVFFPQLLSIHPRNGTCQCFYALSKGSFCLIMTQAVQACCQGFFLFCFEGRRIGFVCHFICSLSLRSFAKILLHILIYSLSPLPAFISPPLLPSRPSLSFLLQCAVPRATVLITLHVSASLYFCHPAPVFFAALPVICQGMQQLLNSGGWCELVPSSATNGC